MGLIWEKKLKQITKELQDSKRMLNQERTKREEEAREQGGKGDTPLPYL